MFEIIDWFKEVLLLLRLTSHQHRQAQEILNEIQAHLNTFEQLTQSERVKCLEDARSRQKEFTDSWNSTFRALPDMIFCFTQLREFKEFLLMANLHEYYFILLPERRHVLNIARIKGVEVERHLAADALTEGKIEIIDELYEKIISLVISEFEISRSYLELRLRNLRKRRGNDNRLFKNLYLDSQWHEIVTLFSGDEHILLLLGHDWPTRRVDRKDLLSQIQAIHARIFASPMGDLDISSTPFGQSVIDTEIRSSLLRSNLLTVMMTMKHC